MTPDRNPFADLGKPTILQVIPALETGGAERTTVDVARAVVAAGGRALVASRGGRMVPELEAVGGEHIELAAHSKNPVVMALNVERLTRLIEREGVSLVHARSRAPAWSALAAARRSGRPFVTTYHSRVHDRPRLKVFYNSVMAKGDAVIANSEYTAQRIRHIHTPDEARVFTVPRGVDIAGLDADKVEPLRMEMLREAWKPYELGPLFIHPARLTRWKGQFLSIEAAKILFEEGVTAFSLCIVGDHQARESYKAELERQITDARLGPHVRICGNCDDMPAAYALADAVISPSIEPEPFGRTAVEAQAMARPVIVSDAGGQRETVRDPSDEGGVEQATGLRVPAGDAGALAAAMRKIIDMSEAERHAMGRNGRMNAVAHYSVGAMCHATLDIYARLLAAK
ncbi:glycosyltransferase involved in cell wall biosynthesis [Parvibaculum indicum]|uniref:glycosyltransferase n=1 Tax=Parvibaculum indicum TaxID=562969 RepID=UPI00141DA64A|nr:glycosyltransferase [Parvibaculum indicum]NIJ40740.1 glycosyltransferase involved in cell wall biosynthesis [Parvibaculum indicum]